MSVRLPRVALVSPKDVHQSLMRIDRQQGAQTHQFTLLMENAEPWTIDDIVTDEDGLPTGVSNERGSAEDKMAALERLEDLLNSETFIEIYRLVIQSPQLTPLEEDLIELCHMLRTSRFELIVRHLNDTVSDLVKDFPERFIRKLHVSGASGNIAAHVLFERIAVLARASQIHAIFSSKATARVQQVIAELRAAEEFQ